MRRQRDEVGISREIIRVSRAGNRALVVDVAGVQVLVLRRKIADVLVITRHRDLALIVGKIMLQRQVDVVREIGANIGVAARTAQQRDIAADQFIVAAPMGAAIIDRERRVFVVQLGACNRAAGAKTDQCRGCHFKAGVQHGQEIGVVGRCVVHADGVVGLRSETIGTLVGVHQLRADVATHPHVTDSAVPVKLGIAGQDAFAHRPVARQIACQKLRRGAQQALGRQDVDRDDVGAGHAIGRYRSVDDRLRNGHAVGATVGARPRAAITNRGGARSAGQADEVSRIGRNLLFIAVVCAKLPAFEETAQIAIEFAAQALDGVGEIGKVVEPDLAPALWVGQRNLRRIGIVGARDIDAIRTVRFPRDRGQCGIGVVLIRNAAIDFVRVVMAMGMRIVGIKYKLDLVRQLGLGIPAHCERIGIRRVEIVAQHRIDEPVFRLDVAVVADFRSRNHRVVAPAGQRHFPAARIFTRL